MMSDVWGWWREAMAGKSPEIHADAPQCGFYKKRDGKNGKWLPVMIRHDDTGALRCRVGDDSGADPFDVWTWCAKNPVSKEDAKVAFETGSFPGEVATIGDNSSGASLVDQVRDFAASALAWLRKSGITDTASKDKAANFRSELLRLRKEADTQREAEKRPHIDANKEIDDRYRPLLTAADDAASALRDALTLYMREEEKKLEAERRAKWEAEQRAADAARREVEVQRAKQAIDDPIAAQTSPEPDLPPAPLPPEPVKVQAGGQRGRKTGLREVTRVVVKDYAAALAHFSESSDVRDLIAKLAERAVRAGGSVPGVETVKEKVAA